MFHMKKIGSILLSFALCAALFTGCASGNPNGGSSSSQSSSSSERTSASDSSSSSSSESQPVAARTSFEIASLKGPTTIGMVKMMSDSQAGNTKHDYKVTMYGSADEIVPKIVNGDVDVAAVPANLASVLYNKTKGGIKIAAINTLGVLYMVENGEQVSSIADLKGKTIYTTGKGTTPEYVLRYLLNENGIDPDKDVTIEFKSEATEVAALLASDAHIIAMLPQPFVTTAQSKNEKIRIALDMTEEWNKTVGEAKSALVTGVVIVRKEFLEKNQAAFDEFLAEYQASTEYVNGNVDEAAKLVGGYDIVPEAVAKKAIPLCNIKFVSGAQMQKMVGGYLSVLFEQNPESVGGTLPDAEFYYVK